MQRFIIPEDERPVAKAREGTVFLSQLSTRDLLRLRRAVKQVHMKFYPADFCTDREADKIIESLGPATVEKLLKAEVDNKLKGIEKQL